MSKVLTWHRFTSHHSYASYMSLFKSETRAKEAFEASYEAIWDVIAVLQEKASYNSEALCGPELWEKYPSPGQHRAIGVAVSAMVEMGFLPLVCVSPSKVTNKRYGVIPEIAD